jgi:hypothetical protein
MSISLFKHPVLALVSYFKRLNLVCYLRRGSILGAIRQLHTNVNGSSEVSSNSMRLF